jgi:hypothetical protein
VVWDLPKRQTLSGGFAGLQSASEGHRAPDDLPDDPVLQNPGYLIREWV